MRSIIRVYFVAINVILITCIISCKNGSDEKEIKPSDSGTPVSVASVSKEPLVEYIELNATSAFLQKSYVKATAGGYVQSVVIQLGTYINNGQVLFSLKTKEAQIVGNTVNLLDSSFKFSGLLQIKANDDGYITQINHQAGDYVQDGEQLAVISNVNSFVFLLDLPYELKSYIINKKLVDIVLPDGQAFTGTITTIMPTVDAVSQTQNIVIKVKTTYPIPENLIAKVRIIKTAKKNTTSLPKAAILTNETQTYFWVMKMIDSVTAIKIPVKKGIETPDRVEIIFPLFASTDKIVITGNYGLPDTAKVKIVQ